MCGVGCGRPARAYPIPKVRLNYPDEYANGAGENFFTEIRLQTIQVGRSPSLLPITAQPPG